MAPLTCLHLKMKEYQPVLPLYSNSAIKQTVLAGKKLTWQHWINIKTNIKMKFKLLLGKQLQSVYLLFGFSVQP